MSVTPSPDELRAAAAYPVDEGDVLVDDQGDAWADDLGDLGDPGELDPSDDGSGADEDGLFPAPVSVAPHTGVPAVDDALADLEQGARDDDLDAQVAAGERAHRELQAQLDDLGTA